MVHVEGAANHHDARDSSTNVNESSRGDGCCCDGMMASSIRTNCVGFADG